MLAKTQFFLRVGYRIRENLKNWILLSFSNFVFAVRKHLVWHK